MFLISSGVTCGEITKVWVCFNPEIVFCTVDKIKSVFWKSKVSFVLTGIRSVMSSQRLNRASTFRLIVQATDTYI